MSKGQIQGQVSENLILQIKIRTCVIPHFHVILTGKSFHGIMFVIEGDLQGQKVNFKVKYHSCGYKVNYLFLTG